MKTNAPLIICITLLYTRVEVSMVKEVISHYRDRNLQSRVQGWLVQIVYVKCHNK